MKYYGYMSGVSFVGERIMIVGCCGGVREGKGRLGGGRCRLFILWYYVYS